jgi:uncharacterized damage-inducible protein DinB
MKKLNRRSSLALLAAAPAGAAALAQSQPPPAAATAKAPSLREGVITELEGLAKKYVGLAEAIPQEKYSWRPAEGVRSISEVLMHVAGANFMLPRMVGVTPPTGLDPKMEKSVTEKPKVVAMVRESFDHFRKGVESMGDPDMNKEAKVFGRVNTAGGGLHFMASHLHEHLGQLIAYARVNGIVPPWSRGREG